MEAIPAARAPGLFHLFAPPPRAVAVATHAAERAPFSYAPVGGTASALPEGFDHNAQQAVIGHGAAAWARAVASLRAWRQFDQPWIRFYDPATPIEPGQVVAFASWQLGVWTLNVCRIVYVIDEADPPRFGFAYGTLAEHSVSGEERFELRWDPQTDEVIFEIRKFSRLRHWMVRAVGPVARAIQARFSRDAIAVMRRAVEAA